MSYFLWLDQVQPSYHSIVGDQALSLSVLMQRGYPVGAGVITAIAFEEFFASIDSLPPLADLPYSLLHLDLGDARQLQAMARQIRRKIEIAPLVADWLPQTWQTPALLLRPQVLHSAAAPANNWFTPQICWAEPAAIATALKRVWGEVFRAKNLLYWQRSNLPLRELRLAVLVQPVSTAIASGRLRWGRDEKLLQGQPGFGGLDGLTDTIALNLLPVQPLVSLHLLQLNSDRQQDCLVHTPPKTPQPILNTRQIQQVMQLAQAIATETSSDIDLEWLLIEQFWITQVRALTANRFTALQTDNLRGSLSPVSDSVLVRGLAASSGQAIGTAWVMKGQQIPDHLPANAIVVARQLPVSLHLSKISGFAIEQGGMTSHSAILARELGIPAIVGAIDATRQVQTGDRVCLDGDRGLLYRVSSTQPPATKFAAPSAAIALPACPQTQLMVNLSQAATLEMIRQAEVAGVGLLRAEVLLLELLQAPVTEATIAQIANCIRPFAEAMYPRPVYYRSIDRSIAADANPLVGLHGAFSYQVESSWFERELLALRQLQQEGWDNLHLLLPFVRTIEEFQFCRLRVQQAGLMQPTFQLWMMAEVPSVLFLLPEYVKAGVQGIAIGSNDLTQLLLGIDRDQPQFASYTAMHPAVLQAIYQLIQTAQQLQIPCSICGQAPSQFPELVALLVQWGITAISVEPHAIAPTAQAIAVSSQS